MQHMLNRQFPFDAVMRWWYILVAGTAIGLVFSLVTDFNPLRVVPKFTYIVEGPPSPIQIAELVHQQNLERHLLFAALGFLVASGVTWLLEEIRAYMQLIQQR